MRASRRIAMFAVAFTAFLPAARAQNDAAPQKEPAPPPSVTVIGARDGHGVLGRFPCGVPLGEHALSVRQQRRTHRCQPDSLAVTLEQRRAKLPFPHPDLLAQCGL